MTKNPTTPAPGGDPEVRQYRQARMNEQKTGMLSKALRSRGVGQTPQGFMKKPKY